MANSPMTPRSMTPDQWTKVRVGWLKDHIVRDLIEIDGWEVREGFQTGENSYTMTDAEFRPLRRDEIYFAPDGTAFLRGRAVLPESRRGKRTWLRFVTSAEFIVKVNGEYLGGFDPYRHLLRLPDAPDGCYWVEMEGYNRAKPGDEGTAEAERRKGCRQVFEGLQFADVDEDARALYDDAMLLVDLMQSPHCLPTARDVISDGLYHALNLVDWDARKGYAAAREHLARTVFARTDLGGEGRVALVGHSHLDIAYFWRRCHSVQKNARTCLIQLELAERYPELRYTFTQAYLFETLEKYYPDIFRRVSEKVRQGAFEIVGGMYVESDCNLPNAESLIRQFFYGQKYFKEKFGKTCSNAWLPDIFGASAILPQILRQCGIRYFVSNKMSTWNDTNRFPHNHFIWRGLDGTDVFAVVPPTHFATECKPSDILKNWNWFQDQQLGCESLCMIGYGDGGSGLTDQMLQFARRFPRTPALPETRMVSAETFLKDNLNDCMHLSVWDGELYLEMHRGTFTTKAQIKRENRRLEVLLREVELANALRWAAGTPYPTEAIEALWKKLLVNQFHDILPGSHIRPVYEDAMRDFREIERDARALLPTAEGAPLYNSLAFARRLPVFVPCAEGQDTRYGVRGDWHEPEMPALDGGRLKASKREAEWISWEASADGIIVRSPRLQVTLAADGSMPSLQDASGREYVQGAFNKLKLFRDIPGRYDAWDILNTYREIELEYEVAEPIHPADIGGEAAVFACTLRTPDSVWERRIRFFRAFDGIEVENKVDWHETHVLAKAEFECAVRAPYALCDTSAGYIARETHRNTTWQQARYEVCQHKWCDLSEAGGGMAILNDGKYGVGLWENVISLSLLRAPCRPDPMADRGEHEFCYMIFPHDGTAVDARVNERALEYNTPVYPMLLPKLKLNLPASMHVQAMKKAGRGDLLVLRLCEQDGKRGKMAFPKPVCRMNALEEAGEWTNEVSYRPFEILTLGLGRSDYVEMG